MYPMIRMKIVTNSFIFFDGIFSLSLDGRRDNFFL